MTAVPNYQTRRTATYVARNYLLQQGYEVLRVVDQQRQMVAPIHLFAWKKQSGIQFICVRSSRIGYGLQDDIRTLSSLVSTGRYPGEIQYWIRDQDRWMRYRICLRGAVHDRGGRQ